MTTLHIPYGLVDDRIVHVDDVPRGKACGARCASCDSDLVARKGEVRIHHFAHHQANGHGVRRLGYTRQQSGFSTSVVTRSMRQKSSLPHQMVLWRHDGGGVPTCAGVHEVDLAKQGDFEPHQP